MLEISEQRLMDQVRQIKKRRDGYLNWKLRGSREELWEKKLAEIVLQMM